MKENQIPPRSIGIYYLSGDDQSFTLAVETLIDMGKLQTGEGMSPYIKKETTRGTTIDVLEVPIEFIRALRRRNREKNAQFSFTAYQLMSNGLLRVLNERTLKSEKPVREMAKRIKDLPKRSATAARR